MLNLLSAAIPQHLHLLRLLSKQQKTGTYKYNNLYVLIFGS